MADVVLQPWSEEDLPLLEKLLGDPEMMKHLGGPESQEQILRRHHRYLQPSTPGTGQMFRIVLHPELEPVGSVGYWEKTWRGQSVYEMGWHVLPGHQGRGIATKAGAAVIDQARLEQRHQFMHAFPSISNPASNAISRKLGFSLIEECQVEYPPGNFMMVNDWRFDLLGEGQ